MPAWHVDLRHPRTPLWYLPLAQPLINLFDHKFTHTHPKGCIIPTCINFIIISTTLKQSNSWMLASTCEIKKDRSMGHCASTMVITSSTRNRIRKKGWMRDPGEHGMLRRSGARCLAVVREKRSRFYIVRRCVVMLIFWHKYGKIWDHLLRVLIFVINGMFFFFKMTKNDVNM